MKHLIILLGLFSNILISAQQRFVGVGTNSPRADLDTNGDFNYKGKLFLDNNQADLATGKAGQLLVSRGVGKSPTWKTLRMPDYEADKYYLIFNESFKNFIAANGSSNNGGAKTGQGVTFTSSEASRTLVPSRDLVRGALLSNLLNNGFKLIGDLSQKFSVNSTTSKTYFLFETVVQHLNTASTLSSSPYACGIFVDGKLESARLASMVTTAASGGSGFVTHTQIGGVENLSKGQHTVDVACVRLVSTNNFIMGIGSPAHSSSDNLNNFMTQSSLKIDVYEIPQNFSPIIIP
ncbi:hypothetical protein [Chryseobacterium sp. T1]